MICYLQPAELTLDSGVQPRSGLDAATVDRYVKAIKLAKDWPFPPVRAFEETDSTLWLSDGFHRVAALGIARQSEETANVTAKVEITPGTRRDAILLAIGCNGEHGLSRTEDDVRRSITLLLLDSEWGQWSERKIAKMCKVGRTRVKTVRGSLEAAGSLARRASEVKFETKHGTIATMNTAAIGRRDNDCDNIDDARGSAQAGASMDTGLTGIDTTTATGAEIGVDSRDSHTLDAVPIGNGPDTTIIATTTATSALDRMRRSGPEPTTREHVLASKSELWFTPAFPADAARKVMGGIELDPASCTEANGRIQADRFYTEDDDGLTKQWKARSLWLNPPYGGQTPKWVDKLIGHYRTDDVDQAMALLNAVPHRRWFQRLWSVSAAVCFLDDMIRFHAPGGDIGGQPTFGNVLFYLTTGSIADFAEAFAPHGRIVVAQSAAAQLARRDPTVKILIEGAAS